MFNYHCFNTKDREHCAHCSKDGQVLTDTREDFICPNDHSNLKCLGEIGGSAAIKTPTTNRIGLEGRKKRNHNHFKKEILPTITDKDAKQHHFKKLGIKN